MYARGEESGGSLSAISAGISLLFGRSFAGKKLKRKNDNTTQTEIIDRIVACCPYPSYLLPRLENYQRHGEGYEPDREDAVLHKTKVSQLRVYKKYRGKKCTI